jgi:hypothetical protein
MTQQHNRLLVAVHAYTKDLEFDHGAPPGGYLKHGVGQKSKGAGAILVSKTVIALMSEAAAGSGASGQRSGQTV